MLRDTACNKCVKGKDHASLMKGKQKSKKQEKTQHNKPADDTCMRSHRHDYNEAAK